MGVKTFYIGKSLDDPKKATIMFQGLENILYDRFINCQIKPILEASRHVYERTKITLWVC